MRTKFWKEKSATSAKRTTRKKSPTKIDVSKLTPSQKQALAAALMGDT